MSMILKIKNGKDLKRLDDTLARLEASTVALNKALNETVELVNTLYQFVDEYNDAKPRRVQSLDLRRIKAGKGLPRI